MFTGKLCLFLCSSSSVFGAERTESMQQLSSSFIHSLDQFSCLLVLLLFTMQQEKVLTLSIFLLTRADILLMKWLEYLDLKSHLKSFSSGSCSLVLPLRFRFSRSTLGFHMPTFKLQLLYQ